MADPGPGYGPPGYGQPPPGYGAPPGYGQPPPGYGPPPGWVVAPSDGWVAPKGYTPDGRVVAEPGRRVLGFLVDLAIWSVPQVGLFIGLMVVIFASAASETTTNPDGTSELPGSTVVLLIALYGLIFVISLVRIAVEAEMVARRGQTWGMKALRLRAVDGRTGGSLTRGRAWGRAAFAALISGQLFGLGYWWAFLDDRRRTLHDLVTSTIVIDER